ncbi:SDR family NAD(P)-dependent oxidoreductase [Streptomyces sp. NPDC002677]|uniref:SDR family NAD(P)-dependent oxidoreductase n=1 Tax=Streptomyces sp. NPDC002677 TaxID=3154774 RepID=UPI00332F7C4E
MTLPVALVTGASSGIGACVADRLAASGRWRLVLNGRDGERLSQVADRTGGLTLPMELDSIGGAEKLAAATIDLVGEVDLLVANAGIGWAGAFIDTPPEMIDRLLAVNLLAPLHLSRALLPGMVRRGRGHLVFVSSIAGCVAVGGEAVYSATKAGLNAFAESLRYEVGAAAISGAGSDVRVSVVVPGAVDTPFFERRGSPYTRGFPDLIPPDQVAETVVRAVGRRQDESFAPGWMRLPARLHGAAPALFRRLAARFA